MRMSEYDDDAMETVPEHDLESEEKEEEEEEEDDQTSEVVRGREPYSFTQCKLCTQTLRNPVTTPCGHNFCMACLATRLAAVRRDADRRCPVCMLSLRGAAVDLRVNAQLAGLVAVASQLVPPQDADDALLGLLVNLEIQAGPSAPPEDQRRLRRLIEGACMGDLDMQRLKTFAGGLQIRLEELAERRRLADENMPAGARAGSASMLCPGERNLVCDYGIRLRARRRFPGLDHAAPYDLIVISTSGSDFEEPGLTALLRLPIYGIAAVRTVVLIGCRPHDVGDVIERVIPAWGAQFGSIVASWAADSRTDTPRTTLWVAAYIGPVQSLQTRRDGRGMFMMRCAAYGSEIPIALFAKFNSMFASYTSCCILGSDQVVAGWRSTVIQPEDRS